MSLKGVGEIFRCPYPFCTYSTSQEPHLRRHRALENHRHLPQTEGNPLLAALAQGRIVERQPIQPKSDDLPRDDSLSDDANDEEEDFEVDAPYIDNEAEADVSLDSLSKIGGLLVPSLGTFVP